MASTTFLPKSTRPKTTCLPSRWGVFTVVIKVRTIGVRAGIGHRQQVLLAVFVLEVFIVKFVAVDRLATRAIEVGEVSALQHELWDNTVEDAAFVVEWLPTIAISFSPVHRARKFSAVFRTSSGEP